MPVEHELSGTVAEQDLDGKKEFSAIDREARWPLHA